MRCPTGAATNPLHCPLSYWCVFFGSLCSPGRCVSHIFGAASRGAHFVLRLDRLAKGRYINGQAKVWRLQQKKTDIEKREGELLTIFRTIFFKPHPWACQDDLQSSRHQTNNQPAQKDVAVRTRPNEANQEKTQAGEGIRKKDKKGGTLTQQFNDLLRLV